MLVWFLAFGEANNDEGPLLGGPVHGRSACTKKGCVERYGWGKGTQTHTIVPVPIELLVPILNKEEASEKKGREEKEEKGMKDEDMSGERGKTTKHKKREDNHTIMHHT